MTDENPYPPGSLAHALREIAAGRRDWPDSGAKRHHYVPQFVLARFAQPRSKVNGKLVQLDVETGRVTTGVAVDKAASKHRFYAVETDASDHDNRIENLLSLLEAHASASISR